MAQRAFFLVAMLGAFSASGAALRSAKLQYAATDGIEHCPGEASLREAVAARLGYWPFAADASTAIDVAITRSGRELNAKLVVVTPEGRRERSLRAGSAECADLTSTLALDISLAIDPLSQAAPVPPAPVVAAPLPAPAPAPTPPPAPKTPLRVEVRLGATGTFGALPQPHVEGLVGAQLHIDRWSLGLEGEAGPAFSFFANGGRVESALLRGTLMGCVHHRWVGACAMVSGGAFTATGAGYPGSSRVTLPWLSVGLRLEGTFRFAERWALGPHLDGAAPLIREVLVVGSETVWSSPVANIGVGLHLSYFF